MKIRQVSDNTQETAGLFRASGRVATFEIRKYPRVRSDLREDIDRGDFVPISIFRFPQAPRLTASLNGAFRMRDGHHCRYRLTEAALNGEKRMKPIRVITISREYGSGGAAIGQKLSERLRWKLLDRELILELARRAHMQTSDVVRMDEHPSSAIARTLKAFWVANYYGWSTPPSDVTDQDYLAKLTQAVILEAAKLGHCVIVGRGAQCVLGDHDDVFHVFIYGSVAEKLWRVHGRDPNSMVDQAILYEVDRTRATYVRQYYKTDWMNPQLYHLMVNSALGLDRSASVILEAAELAQTSLGTVGSSSRSRR
jgi:cytidylate kinase